jgi:hypothetical protein
MATYIQGVSSYIPQFQPYQPDLNFESGLLQQKQTQYDTNWKALNNVYGQYFYADLTRDPNVKKKEDLLRNIDFNLKRVAGLDLSLSQNTDQAMQVFKPFYEDKTLMKDMAWTKTKNAQRNYGLSLKNDPDKGKSKMYWDDGIKAIDYLTDEFRTSSDEESMKFGNVAYTPFRNVMTEARELAKASGIKMNTPSFSEDGKWMYQTKNGQQIMEPLSKLFEAELGSDPGIQDVYRTKAYVQRKDYVEGNAAQFNGDKTAAEMQYLQENFKVLKDQVRQEYKNSLNVSNAYDSKIADIEKQIKNGTARQGSEKYLEDLKNNKAINDKVLERFRSQNEEYLTEESTAEVSTGFQNPYGDIKSLRMKVDNGVTWNKISKDLDQAAQISAYIDYEVTQKENPYAVLAEKQAGEMAQIAARNAGTLAAVRARNKGEAENINTKWRLESGTSILADVPVRDENGNVKIDPRTGQVVMETQLVDNNAALYARRENAEGGVTDEVDVRKIQKFETDKLSNAYALPYWDKTRDIFNKLKLIGQLSQEELNIIQYGTRKLKPGQKPRDVDDFFSDMALYSKSNPERIKGVKGRIDEFLNAHAHLKDVSSSKAEYDKRSISLQSYVNFAEDNLDYTLRTSKLAKQELLRSGVEKKYLDLAFDSKTGRLKSQEEFEYLVNEKYGEDRITAPQDVRDPATNERIKVTNKNYNDLVLNFGKKIFEKGNKANVYQFDSRYFKSGEQAKQLFRERYPSGSSKGTPISLTFTNLNGKTTRIEKGDSQSFQKLLDPNKSYIVKQVDMDTNLYDQYFGVDTYRITEVDPKKDKEKIYKKLGQDYIFDPGGSLAQRNSGNKVVEKYKEMKEALGTAYSSSEIMKIAIPSIGRSIDPGTGLATDRSTITVTPKNLQTPGSIAMLQFLNQMSTLDLDGQSTLISMNGVTKSAIDEAKLTSDNSDTWADFSQTAKGKALLRGIQQEFNNPYNSQLKPFDISYQSIVGNDMEKEAMIIKPTVEWLKQFVASGEKTDENGQGNNLLTLSEFNSFMKNGISVVAPVGTFDNSLVTGSSMSPFVASAKYRSSYGIPLTYEDPYGQGSITLNDDPTSNSFIFTAKDKIHKENSRSWNVQYSQAEQDFNQYIDILDMLSQQNNNTYSE